MTYKELQAKSVEELLKLSKEKRDEIFMLRIKSRTGQLEKTHQLKAIKGDIARIETRLSELARLAAKAS